MGDMSHRSTLIVCGFILCSLLATTPAIAQQADRPPPAREQREGMLIVAGEGQVQADPDFAIVRLGASVQAEEASEAQRQVNEIMQRSIEAVKNLGVDEQRIRTTDLSLYPVYDDRQPRDGEAQDEPRVVGYRASNVIAVELEDLKKIGEVIDVVIEAGANQLQGVEFQLRDDAIAKRDALRQAVESARMKARILAEAAGVSIGGIVELREGGTDVRPPEPMYRGGYAMEVASTPVQPGQLTVNASVTIVYRLAPGDAARPNAPATRPANR